MAADAIKAAPLTYKRHLRFRRMTAPSSLCDVGDSFCLADEILPVKSRAATTRPRFITDMADVKEGVRALRRQCVHLRAVHDQTGDPPLRRQAAGLPGLARIIIGQQVSTASAAAIWARFEAMVRPLTAAYLLTLDDAGFRAPGLSSPKIRTLRAVASAIEDGLDLDGLAHVPAVAARETLLSVKGIGPWSADIYLMFCLGHADVFAPGDLALQVATSEALRLPARPTASEMAVIAERWAPWRAVAARLLWAFYAHNRRPDAGLPVETQDN
jgi:DNA-3-methyladenine glycosylase II